MLQHIKCPCGCYLMESSIRKHLQTAKHWKGIIDTRSFDKVNCDDKPKAPFYGTYRTSAIVKVPLYGIEILVKVNHENWEFILETLE